MIKKRTTSQIATIVVFMIAVIFLFTLISINISKVSQKKTAIDNIADSVGLQLASQLGSMANALKHEMEIYGSKNENCEWNWQLTIGLGLLALVVIVLSVISFGGFTVPGIVIMTLASTALGGATLFAVGVTQQYIATKPGAVKEMEIKFQTLSALQQVIERPIQGVLFALVDDPTWTPDEYDIDQDDETGAYGGGGNIVGDRVPRFFKWYNLRLNSLPRLGDEVKNFYNEGFWDGGYSFFIDDNGEQRFFIDEDENLIVKKGKDAVRWWIDYDGDGPRDLKLVPWLRDDFRGMLTKMREHGYGINVSLDDEGNITIEPGGGGTEYFETNALEEWIDRIEEFEDFVVRALYNLDYDSAVQGIDTWLSVLKNNEEQDWSRRLKNWEARFETLIAILKTRKSDIHECVEACGRNEWDCCGGDGPCCRQRCNEYGCWCVQWMGCCGAWRDCGQLCNDPHCPPQITCDTPTGGSMNCCDSGFPLEPYCANNIIEVYNGYNAITVLEKFWYDVIRVRALIETLYKRVKDIEAESYDVMHEAFYLWVDKVGGASSEGQEVAHIAYAKIEGLDPGAGFDIPHMAQPRTEFNWYGVSICYSVASAEGDFTLSVARFDEDTAKKGPLSRLWRFRFGHPKDEGFDSLIEGTLHQVATQFQDDIAKNKYAKIDDEATKNLLRTILNSFGMVSRVNVHYGPGVTEKDQASVPAEQRNEDIYIKETFSNLW